MMSAWLGTLDKSLRAWLYEKWPNLARPEKYERLLQKVAQYSGVQKREKAKGVCDQIIQELLSLPWELSPEHRQCLGSAYLKRGELSERESDASTALDDYREARAYIALPDQTLGSVANWLTGNRDASAWALEVYLEYLKLKSDTPESASADPVHTFVRSLCVVDDDATNARLVEVIELAQQIIGADYSLTWAQYYWHYYMGLKIALQGDCAAGIHHMDKAFALSQNQDALFFSRVYQGILRERESDFDNALNLYEAAAALEAEKPDAHFLLAKLLVERAEELERKDEPGAPEQVSRMAQKALRNIVPAISIRPESADYHFYRGRACALAGDYNAAVEAYQQAVSIEADKKYHHLFLAIALGHLSDVDGAVGALEKSLALDPSFANALQVWGDLLIDAGQYQEAREKFRRALALDATHSGAKFGLAKALYLLGNYTEAVGHLQDLGSAIRGTVFLLARCHALAGQFKNALDLLIPLVQRPDARWEDLYYLGCAHANLGELEPATRAFSACLEKDTEKFQAYQERGNCYLAEEKWEEARRDCEAALRLEPERVDTLLALARYYLLRDPAAAEPHLQKALQADPEHWEIFLMTGMLKEQTGDLEAAKDAYRKTVEKNAQNAAGYVRLGLVYFRLEAHEEACRYLQEAVERGEETDEVLYHLGHAQVKCGSNEAALAAFKKLGERHPDDAQLNLNIESLYYLLGKEYVEDGRCDEAVHTWQKLLETQPEDRQLREQIAELYFRLGMEYLVGEGDRHKGRERFEAAVELDGEHILAKYYLALCNMAAGEWQAALGNFQQLSSLPAELHDKTAYCRGVALYQIGEYQESAALLETIAENPQPQDGGLPIAWTLAAAYVRGQNWEKALNVLNQ